MQNTWASPRKSIPLWVMQGIRHYHRRAACDTPDGSPAIPESILEPEAQSLMQRYRYDGENPEERLVFQDSEDQKVDLHKAQLNAIRSKCRELGVLSFRDSSLHEEQERELQPENEREQQVREYSRNI